eukprot:6188805-Pleurochrysis_carterae.AAC.2
MFNALTHDEQKTIADDLDRTPAEVNISARFLADNIPSTECLLRAAAPHMTLLSSGLLTAAVDLRCTFRSMSFLALSLIHLLRCCMRRRSRKSWRSSHLASCNFARSRICFRKCLRWRRRFRVEKAFERLGGGVPEAMAGPAPDGSARFKAPHWRHRTTHVLASRDGVERVSQLRAPSL